MKARLKTEVQDVWQCDGAFKLGVPRWVFGCTEAREDGLYLVRGADKQRIDYGDYLVRDLDGATLWMTEAGFQRDYEVVP